MVPHIVPAYAALLALFFLFLSVRVMRARGSTGVAIGTGGDATLERRVRVHANFAEYVPLALILLLFMEIEGTRAWYLHLLCLALLAGRAAHAYGVSQDPDILALRAAGMVGTFFAIAAAALTLLVRAL
jgi:hypothetical protein